MPTPVLLTAAGTSTSGVWTPDWFQTPFSVGFGISPAGATTVVQVTYDDLNVTSVASATWYTALTTGVAATGAITSPVTGIRLNTVTALSTGLVTGLFLQATNAP